MAKLHGAVRQRGYHFLSRQAVDALQEDLFEARRRCAEADASDGSARRAAEWLLDNDFLIRRVFVQLRRELPAGFQRRLPLLEETGRVRAVALAEALYENAPRELELGPMERFLDAYQDVTSLTIAELWALPALLRLVILRRLRSVLEGTDPGQRPEGACGAEAGRAVLSLRLLAEISWKDVFSRQSVTEHLLRRDPAAAYGDMDFETRDAYRRAVEEISLASGRSEPEVAAAALERCAEHTPGEPDHHVGHHLLGEGRPILERSLGARVVSLERMVLLWPKTVFFGMLGLLQLAILLPLVGYAVVSGASLSMVLWTVVLSWIPASVPASGVTRWLLARWIRPRALPKLDFTGEIPDRWRTLVAVPTLLGERAQIERVVQRLEAHYLANPDPRLSFALLTDHVDTDAPPEDADAGDRARRLAFAERCIRQLNARHRTRRAGPFHLLHRTPRWNAAEGKWMGWERKRGKIEELNRYLLGAADTTYSLHAGEPDGLRGIAFVLTLDSDTQLPTGAAARLVGTLAHPLNRPRFDERGRVARGYTVLQPRVEISPRSAGRSLFSRLFAGDAGIDIYTRAVSETYQDLFGEGIYVGKGIYDLPAFKKALENRVPENALLSHDLFEGIHGRAGLVTDVVVYEDYPSHYAAFIGRLHRWVRGDWQLLPWLFPRVPVAQGGTERTRLGLVDRFKIADNLRRSLVWPGIMAMLIAGWLVLPGHPLFWTLTALLASGAAVLSSLVRQGLRGREEIGRWFVSVCFAPQGAVVAVDAIVRVLVRMSWTRRRLLEWTTAEQVADRVEDAGRLRYLEYVWAAPVVTSAIALAIVLVAPASLPWAAPLLLLWLASPEIAWRISRPIEAGRVELDAAEIRDLRRYARRTWLFFETFVGPTDNWLPVDHFQEHPLGVPAHRTSPTNIGMLLTSQLAAYDLGYIGREALASWTSNTLGAIEGLERYRGHLYNWYDTRTLEPLEPRYVSTVDSGNLVGCLLTAAVGCEEAADASATERRGRMRAGLRDTAALLLVAIEQWTGTRAHADRSGRTRAEADRTRISALRETRSLVDTLEDEQVDDLEALEVARTRVRDIETDVFASLKRGHATFDDPSVLRELRVWLSALLRQVGELQRDTSGRAAEAAAVATSRRLHDIARRLRVLADDTDFAFLYDEERRLFQIGYNATADRRDAHHYDLLASEARLASFIAVARGEVPLEHWFALGRPLMPGDRRRRTLLSWGGSMFEYLMPRLFMRSHANTLLYASYEGAVATQIEYGAKLSVPWGISESGYAFLDGRQQYQYRAFGVPGLGLRRGLREDVVVAPYACFLGLPIRPRAVLRNLEALVGLGALGRFGFFEALDFHPRRAPGHRPAIVRSYMAHHHGMSLVAIANALTDDRMVARFHANPVMRSSELLLDERIPAEIPAERPTHVAAGPTDVGLVPEQPRAWEPDPATSHVWAVGNNSLTSFVTSVGGGGLRRRGLGISRWDPDPSADLHCRRAYVVDTQSGDVMGVAPDPDRSVEQDAHVVVEAGRIEIRHRQDGLAVRLRVTVTPRDDVEIQEIELANEGQRARSLRIVGCLEPAIAPEDEVERHPAFSKMFLRSAPMPDLGGALVTRMGRDGEVAPWVAFRMVCDDRTSPELIATDRREFIGREGTARRPEGLLRSGAPVTSRTLDALCATAVDLTLEPGARRVVALVTAVAPRRSEAVELAGRVGSTSAVRWAFQDAGKSAARKMQRLDVPPKLLPAAQRLLDALLVAQEEHRAPSDVLARGRPAPRKLWGLGISGDEPIVVVCLDRNESTELLGEVLAVHRYLQTLGVGFDVVLIDHGPTTYDDPGNDELNQALSEHHAMALLRQRGGVHIVRADQMGEQELLDLRAAGRVHLDATAGSLEEQLRVRVHRPTELPPFEPVAVPPRPPSDAEPAVEPPALWFENGFGGVDGDEYVILPGQTPPAPWCNVLANERVGCLLSEAAMGSTWSLNAGENRLTPWHNDPVADPPSEVLYLRDEETGRVWSTTPRPVGVPTLVHHGQGHTRYRATTADLEHVMTVFVPPDLPAKIVRLSLRNLGPRPRRVTATYYAEWVLGSRRGRTRPFVFPDASIADSCLLAETSWSIDFGDRTAFLASDRPVHGFTSDRIEMIGRSGDLSDPAGLRRWGLSGRARAGLDPCGALQVHVDLDAGEETELCFFIGQADDRDGALDVVRRLREPGAVDAAWAACRAFWDEHCGAVLFRTPDPALDALANRWLPYQTLASRFFGRTALYQSSGAYGFRDQLQDSLLLLHSDPGLTRRHLLESAAHQFAQGDVLHWWHPVSEVGVRTRCSDDLLWLVYVTHDYVRATGDREVLFERVPFLEGEPLTPAEHERFARFPHGEDGTLLEHCRRALARGFTAGPHGLPLIGDGDWNDGMSAVGREGRGESVWLGWFVHSCTERFAALLESIGASDEAEEWRDRLPDLREAMERHGWDGLWYRRAYYDDGTPIGAKGEEPPHIDSIAQSWAVLSGAGALDRVDQALASAERKLVDAGERLVLLLDPPFSRHGHDPGYIAAYPAGVRENGGQYTHAAAWLGLAHAARGDGDAAYRIASLLNPLERTRTRRETERYRVEPYVIAADVYSIPPLVGRGGWTWYTGSAAWTWRLVVEGILGLRRRGGALEVDPCLPSHWDGFEAWVSQGELRVHVVVHNGGRGRGVEQAVLDGEPLEEARVELTGAGERRLEIRLGARADAEEPASTGRSADG